MDIFSYRDAQTHLKSKDNLHMWVTFNLSFSYSLKDLTLRVRLEFIFILFDYLLSGSEVFNVSLNWQGEFINVTWFTIRSKAWWSAKVHFPLLYSFFLCEKSERQKPFCCCFCCCCCCCCFCCCCWYYANDNVGLTLVMIMLV